jgi:hypothetical protein
MNLGPLKTTFTPSSTCFDVTAYLGPTSLRGGLPGLEPFNPLPTSYAEPCFPSFSALRASKSSGFFSPGVCPLGYSMAHSNTSSDETQAICCPTGYKPHTDDRGCHSRVAGLTIVSSVYFSGSTLGKLSVTLSDPEFDAVPVSIRYRAADFSTAVSSAIFNSIPATSSFGGNSVKISPTPPAVGNHVLSPGAKAGIAMGSLIGAITILGGIFGFVLLHRRRQNQGKPSELHGVSAQKHELDGSPEQKHELHGSSIEELDCIAVLDPGMGNLRREPEGSRIVVVAEPVPIGNGGVSISRDSTLPLGNIPPSTPLSTLEPDSPNLTPVQRNPPLSPLASTSRQSPLPEQNLTAGPVPTHLETVAHPQLTDRDRSYDCLLQNCSRTGDEAFSLESLRDKHLREFHGLAGEEVELIKARRKKTSSQCLSPV